MKRYFRLLVVIFAVASFQSCSNSSSSTTEVSDSGPLDTNGADYMPLQSGQTIVGHFRGSHKAYDGNGILTGEDSIDQDRSVIVMGPGTPMGIPGFSIGAYDDFGHLADNGGPSFYIATSGSVYGTAREDNDRHLILPATLSTGLTWSGTTYTNAHFSATLVHHFATYVNQMGHSYATVIQVDVHQIDSAYSISGQSGHEVDELSASLYFAKDVGLVDAVIRDCSFTLYSVSKKTVNSKDILSGFVSK